MKKQTTDAGLGYLKRIGIRAAKDRNNIRREMERLFGKDKTNKYYKEFNDLCEKGDPKSYDVKNNDYDMSIFFTGSFDADIIRKCCNWINDNKESFGNNILDVGCDCGFVTCFLAMMLPDARITSIDRSANGVVVAEKLAKKLGITNINFVATELADFEEADFDTVFTMRTVTENGNFAENPENTFIKQKDEFCLAFKEYGKLLSSKVKDGGNLITIENITRDPLLYAIIESLYEEGFSGQLNKYKEITCNEIGFAVKFQALVFTKTRPDESGEDFYNRIYDSIERYSSKEIRGWEARYTFETQKCGLIDGYSISGPGSDKGSIFALYKAANDKNDLILYQNYEGEPIIHIYSEAEREEAEKVLNDYIEDARKYSLLVVEKLN